MTWTRFLSATTTTLTATYVLEPRAREEDLARDWQPATLASYFSQRPWLCARRAVEIVTTLGPLGVSYFNGHEKAVELREGLTRLGPAFVKFGQAMSIRPDVVPTATLTELRKLQDSVPAVPTPHHLLPFQVHTPPIAAASLGQVYKCEYEGRTVALKVQRPDIITSVALDLTLLRWWAHLIEAFKTSKYDVKLIEAFGRGAWGELDYEKEAQHQTRMRLASKRKFGGRVVIPQVRYASRKVIITDWIDGVKLAEAPPQDIRRLVPLGVELFLWQMLEYGEYHCDPHPGNLLVVGGRLALIDFGLCCTIDRPSAKAMTTAVVHLMQGDVPGLLEDAISLDFLPTDVDKSQLLPVLESIFHNAKLSQVEDVPTKRRRKAFAAVSSELNDVFFHYPFHVPDYFALITRALIILEGIAINGDPNFDIFAAAYPYAIKLVI